MRTKLDTAEIRLVRNLLDILVKNRGGKPEDYQIYYFINLRDEEKLAFRNKETLTVFVYKGLYKYHQRMYERLPLYYVPVLTLPDAMIPKKAINLTEEVLKVLPHPFSPIPDCYSYEQDKFLQGPPPTPNKEKS